MTPETDAARVGIAGFLDALDPRVDTILTLQRADKPIPLKASHLRLVLAALDEEPPSAPDTGKLCCCGTGADLRTAANILTEALDAENVTPELASRILNRFLFGDPRGLDAGSMPHPETSHDD